VVWRFLSAVARERWGGWGGVDDSETEEREGRNSTYLDNGSGSRRGVGLLEVGDCGWGSSGCWEVHVRIDQKEEPGVERRVQWEYSRIGIDREAIACE